MTRPVTGGAGPIPGVTPLRRDAASPFDFKEQDR